MIAIRFFLHENGNFARVQQIRKRSFSYILTCLFFAASLFQLLEPFKNEMNNLLRKEIKITFIALSIVSFFLWIFLGPSRVNVLSNQAPAHQIPFWADPTCYL